MTNPPDLVFVRDLHDHFETRHQYARAAIARRSRRVARGVYVDADTWTHLDADARYLARVEAVARTRRSMPVLSHWSAAVVHGLPRVGAWPNDVHITTSGSGWRSRAGVIHHSRRLDEADITEVRGLTVTTVERTVLDIATIASRMEAVAVADRALLVDRFGGRPALTTRESLLQQWDRDLPFRGHARARDTIDFAETRAETAIESVSRVVMREIGCPRPHLQVAHRDADGLIGETDFAWPEHGILGEADGDRKYLDAAFRSGRSAEQVFLDEKVREDRLRAVSSGFVRWRWNVARDAARLSQLLSGAGLPLGIRW